MRILLVKTVDPAFASLHEVLQMLGHESKLVTYRISFVELQSTLTSFQPELIILNNTDLLSENVSPDYLAIADLLENGEVPVAVWDFEAPYFVGGIPMMMRWNAANYFKSFLFFHVDSFYADQYRLRGNSAHFLPFYVDSRMENYRVPQPYASSFQHELTYVGTAFSPAVFRDECETGTALVDYFLLNARADIIQTLRATFVPQMTNAGMERIDSFLFDSLARLFKSDIHDARETQKADEAWARRAVESLSEVYPSLRERSVILLSVLITRIRILYSYFQVASRLEALGNLGIRIYGEGEWNRILTHDPHKIRRLSYPELFAAFHNSRFIFGFTKKLFIDVVHERVFQIFSAGGCPLFDHRNDFDLLFEPGSVLTYRSMEEIPELLKFYGTHESERKKMIEKARKQLFERHTLIHRAKELLKISGEHFGINTNAEVSKHYRLDPAWIENLYHPPKIGTEV